MSVLVGEPASVAILANYDDGNSLTVTSDSSFVSDDESVAIVNPDGEIMGAAEGTTQITASYEEFSAIVDVTVEAPPTEPDPEEPEEE